MRISIPNSNKTRSFLYAGLFIAAVALLLFTSVGSAQAHSKSKQIRGSGDGVAVIDGVVPGFPGDPDGCFALGGSSPSCVIGFKGDFRATGFGRGELSGFVINDWSEVLGGLGVCAASSGGEISFKAANGDVLNASQISGEVCIVVNTFDVSWEVTGGTGRFEGATGRIRTAGPAIVVDENGNFLPEAPMPDINITGRIRLDDDRHGHGRGHDRRDRGDD